MDLISVIVPVYKVENYIDRCISSIINQSYSNIEIILVDDGSPDNCPQICDGWAQKDKRIHVIHKKNEGVSEARNVGIEYAHGDWIMFADSDDWVSPYFCEHALKCGKEADADLICFGYVESKKICVDIEGPETYGLSKILEKSDALLMLVNGEIKDYVWNKLYRANLFQAIKYPVGRVMGEDLGTTYLLFDKAKKIVALNEKLYFYYQNNSSVTHVVNLKYYIDFYEGRLEQYNFMLDKYPDVAEVLKNFLLHDALEICIYVIPNGNYSDAFSKANKTIESLKNYKSKLDRKHRALLFLYLKCKPLFYLICKRKNNL